jgi:hypothetical protein
MQISYKLINDKDFLSKYGWDEFLNTYLDTFGLTNYMPIIGFSKPRSTDSNIIMLFLSPIIFYISTSVLKDHFSFKINAD